jgi:hypothetical protein
METLTTESAENTLPSHSGERREMKTKRTLRCSSSMGIVWEGLMRLKQKEYNNSKYLL